MNYKNYEIEHLETWVTTIDNIKIEAQTEEEIKRKIDEHLKVKEMEEKLKEVEEKEKKKEEEEKKKWGMKPFKISIAEPDYIKKPVKLLRDILTGVRMDVMKDKIRFYALDPANVSMVVFELLSSACIEYDSKEEFKVMVSASQLYQILKNARKNDIVVLSDDGEKLKIALKSNSIREYSIDVESEEYSVLKIPELKFKSEVTMDSKEFFDNVKECDTMADSVIFETKGTKFFMKPVTEAEGRASILSQGESKGESIVRYSLEYLKKITMAKSLNHEVVLRFSKDYPLRAEYNVIDKFNFYVILAPRITDD